MFENSEKTTLAEIGEFGLIDRIEKHVVIKHPTTLKGIGDDAAVLDAAGEQIVVTTDLLVEGVHFDVSYTPLKHLGYKAVVVNVSDVYAMNATPRQITISVALSSKYTLEAVEELYAGILLACQHYQVDLVGGDTTTSPSGLTISVTAIGYAPANDLVYRNGAQINDLVCVSGTVGAAYAGLQVLEREKRVYLENPNVQPDLEGYDYVLERQLKPEARKDIIQLLKGAQIKPTSMMDISDGLASELKHICKQSQVGCRLDMERIPLDQGTIKVAEELNFDPLMMALNGGEDYELLFTVSPSAYDKVQALEDVHVIGFITEAHHGIVMVDRNNVAHPIQAQGWDSFKQQAE